MAYYQPAQIMVSGSRVPSGKDYVFIVQRAVSMAWVEAGDVPALRSMNGGCCGRRKRLFAYATEGQVSVWTDGTRGPNGGADPCGCK